MKIYRCDFYDPDEGACVSWHASEAEALGELRRQQRARGTSRATGPEGVTRQIIPTDRAGLIDWLNSHFTRDNG